MGLETTMVSLRDQLAQQRRQLIDGLTTQTGGGGVIEPATVRLLADVQTAIAAVEAELTDREGGKR
jgi:hypothetical protein